MPLRRLKIHALRVAAQQAKTAEARERALRLLNSAVSDPALSAEAWCLIGRLRRDGGDARGAIEAYRNGGAALDGPQAPPAWGPLELGSLLHQVKDARGAMKVLRAALAASEPAPDPALLGALGHAALALWKEVPDVEAIAQRAIETHPFDRGLVEGWFDVVRARSSAEQALARLEMLQAETQLPLYAVLLRLAETQGYDKVRARFAERFAQMAARSPFAECARVWRAHIEGREPDPADCAVIVNNRERAAEFFFHFLSEAPRQLPVMRAHKKTEAALAELGVQTLALREFLRDFMEVWSDKWREMLDRSTIENHLSRERFQESERESGYLDRLVATGTLRMMDPFTGASLEALDSVIIFGRTIYTFRGKELFYLVCGKPWSGALGLHIPRLNVSIPFAAVPTSMLGTGLFNVLAILTKRLAKRGATPGPQAASPAHARGGLVLYVGATENFAHQVWNFYGAIERLIVTGLVDRLSRVLFSGTEFFGPLSELFPELARIGIDQPRKRNVIDPFPFGSGGFVLPTGGFFVARSLIQRIVATMRRRPRASTQTVEPADVPRKPGAPVIWIGMRLRDKAWADQENGTRRIIEIIAERYPGALFLLDGFSYPVGRDQVSERWTDVIAALRAMAERMCNACAMPDRVVNMVGNTFRESVLWAQETDVYLAPYGSTQHKIGWFTDAPGLVYVPPNFSPAIAARSPACAVVDGVSPPNFIFAEPASAGERRGFNRRRERFANVTLDADIVAGRLIALLEARLAQRASRPLRTPGA